MCYTHYGVRGARGGDCSLQGTWHRRRMRLCVIVYALCCIKVSTRENTLYAVRSVWTAKCSAPCSCQSHVAFARHSASPFGIETKGTEVVQCLRNRHAVVVPMCTANPPRLVRRHPVRRPLVVKACPQIPNIMEAGIRQRAPRSQRAEVVREAANLSSTAYP